MQGPWFWAKESHKIVWHAVEEGEIESICRRAVRTPRLTQKFLPEEDERCSKCDRILWPDGNR